MLLTIFARTYMAPYSQPSGQVALGVIVAGFGLTLAWFARLARPVLGARFLRGPPDDAGTRTTEQPSGLTGRAETADEPARARCT